MNPSSVLGVTHVSSQVGAHLHLVWGLPRAEAGSFHAADVTVFPFWAPDRRIKENNTFLTICAVLIFMFSF